MHTACRYLDIGVDGKVLLRALGEVVDAGVLDDRREDEEEAHQQEYVECGGVGDLRDAGSTSQPQRARRQQRRYSCKSRISSRPTRMPLTNASNKRSNSSSSSGGGCSGDSTSTSASVPSCPRNYLCIRLSIALETFNVTALPRIQIDIYLLTYLLIWNKRFAMCCVSKPFAQQRISNGKCTKTTVSQRLETILTGCEL